MMTRDKPAPMFRRKLLLSTALAGIGACVASPAGAQTLPTPADVVSTATNPGGTPPTVSNPNATTLQVDLKAQSTLINWNGFNVPAANAANFLDATTGIGNLAVLNRDINGVNPSQILGSLNAPSNVTVYVINPLGVIFGGGSAVNVGSLIASSLDVDATNQTAFLNGATSLTFAGAAGATAGITVNGSLTATGASGLGHLVLLGPAVTTSGATLTASGDVAVVAGTDITVTNAGSPLSFVINQGTTVNNAVTVSGTVNGRNVTFAAARPSALADTLLSVSGTVTATGAAATDRGIVLVAGQSGPGVTVALPSNNIGIDASGATFVSAKDGTFVTGKDLNVGSASVDGNYSVTAANFLGNALAPTLNGTGSDFSITDTAGGLTVGALTAPGTLSITTLNGGNLTANGNLTSTSEAVSLSSAGLLSLGAITINSAGAQTLGATSGVSLTGNVTMTSSGGGTITFNAAVDGAKDLSVGTAGSTIFNSAVGAGTPLASLTVTGPTTLNASQIKAAGAISLAALSLGAGAPPSVTVSAGGPLSFSGAITAATADANSLSLAGSSIGVGNVGVGGRLKSVSFSGPTTLTGNVNALNSATFLSGLTLSGAGIRKVTAGSASFQAVDSAVAGTTGLSVNAGTTGAVGFNAAIGGTGALSGLAVVAGSASFTGTNKVGTLAANVAGGGFSFTNGQALTIGTFDGLNGVTLGAGPIAITTTGATSDLNVNQPVQATAGSVTLTSGRDLLGTAAGTISAGGAGNGVTLNALAGAVNLGGTVTSPGSFSATALNSITLVGATSTGGDVSLKSNAGNVTVNGNVGGVDVAISSAGTISTGAITAQDDIVLRSTGATATGALTSGTGANAAGAGDALAGVPLPGGDIDVVANGIVIAGLARANGGSSSDIRLSGGATGTGDLTRNLDLGATGDITVSGAGRGIDILMNAGGNLKVDALTATGAASLTAGSLLTMNAPVTLGSTQANDLTLQAANFAGVALTGPMIGGDDLTITDTAGGLSVGPLSAPGTLTINVLNGGLLNVTGTLASVNEDIALTTIGGGDIALNSGGLTTGTGAGRTITLTSSGAISQVAGTAVTTNTLNGSAVGTASLGSTANAILNLGGFTAASLLLRNGAALTISGAVNGTNGVDVATQAGDLTVSNSGSVTTGTGAVALTGAGNLFVNGAVTSVSGAIGLTASAGSIGLGANVSTGSTLTVNASAAITQTAGVLSAGTLTGSSGGATSLVASTNQIGTLAGFSANGFALADGGGLTISGPVNGAGGGVSVTTSGDLAVTGAVTAANAPISLAATGGGSDITLAGAVNAGAGTVTLNAGATISQSGAGVVTAGTLTGGSAGSTNLATLTNQITNLGAFTANGFSLLDGGGLTVTGLVAGGAGGIGIQTSGDLTVNAGLSAANAAIGLTATGAGSDILLNAPVNAGTGTVTLAANGGGGTIGQTAPGVVTAGTLTGGSSGATTLTAALNAVSSLGAFTSTGFALRNDPALTVTGPVNAGAGALSIEVVGDPLAINGNLTGTGVTLKATGISQLAGSIVDAGAGTILVDADGGAIDMAGTLTTTNGGASAVQIIDSGNAALGRIATGAGGTVTLGTAAAPLAGNVSQNSGAAITAGSLVGQVGGSATLANAGNDIATLGAFTTGTGFSLTDANTLNVTGPVAAGTGNLILQVTTGPLSLAGNLDAASGTVTLNALNGAITQSSGRIKAATLTGQSTGGTTLNAATNDIATLAGFTNTGAVGISLVDSRDLTVTAAVNAGAGDLSLKAVGIDFTGQTLTAGHDVLLDAQTGALTGGTITGGNNVTGTGASIGIANATATAGALALTAATGQLTLGTGNAGTTATLIKSGATGDLQVTTSLTSGNAAANGDATITSSTSARLAAITSKTGNVVADALTGQVTGIGTGGRANLTAQANTKNVTVRAGTLALLGTVSAGQDVSVTAGNTTTPLNGSIDVTSVAGRDVALDARGGTVTAGTVTARDDIAIRASGAVAATTLVSGATIGAQGPVDASGVADTLAGALTGNDIDVVGASVNVGAATANGAGSDVRLTANTGQLILGTGSAGQDMTLRATAALAQVGTVNVTRDLLVQALGIDFAGQTLAAGHDVLLDAQTGALTGGTITGGNNVTGTGASIGIANATATAGALALTAATGQLTLGTGNAGTTATLIKSGATGDLQVTTSLTSGNAAANGDATITSSKNAFLAAVTSKTGNVVVDALTGQVAGIGTGGRANLTAQANTKNVTVRAGTLALLGAVGAGQDVSVTAGNTPSPPSGSIDVTSIAARDVALDARGGTVTAGTVTARDDIAIRASGAVAATTLISGATIGAQGPVDASGVADTLAGALTGNDIDVVGASVNVGAATANGAGSDVRLTANTGQLILGTGSAGQDMTLRATAALAQVGTAAATRNLLVEAIDLDLTGAATAATAQFTNLGTGPMRLGNGTGTTGGFNLSQAEVNRIAAANVTFQSGARDVEIGALAFGNAVGATQLNILTTGRVDVIGEVTTTQGAGTTRTVRIGGDTGTGQASVIRVAATSAGGGRLLMGNSLLDLRAARIGVGEDADFLSAIGLTPGGTPLGLSAVAANYIGNAGSRLYNPSQPYSNGILLTASRLTVTYTEYALFQNTAFGGLQPRGVQIGSLGATQTLALNSTGAAAPNGLALFGEINGRGGSQAALLGPTIIVLSGANPSNTRINGCLVGSGGGGCLISAVSTPPINLFDQSKANIIRAANELPLSFDPVIGANNEALFSGLRAIDAVVTQPDCRDAAKGAPCPATQEEEP